MRMIAEKARLSWGLPALTLLIGALSTASPSPPAAASESASTQSPYASCPRLPGAAQWKTIATYNTSYQGNFVDHYSWSAPNFPSWTGAASYQWTLTSSLRYGESVANGGTAVFCGVTTTQLTASGGWSSDKNQPAVNCSFHTPAGYGWTSAEPLDSDPRKTSEPHEFSWSIASPPQPGSSGVTGSTAGTESGCIGSAGTRLDNYGFPGPVNQNADAFPLSGADAATFTGEATNGTTTLPVSKLPYTKSFDLAGSQTQTLPGGSTQTGSLTFTAQLSIGGRSKSCSVNPAASTASLREPRGTNHAPVRLTADFGGDAPGSPAEDRPAVATDPGVQLLAATKGDMMNEWPGTAKVLPSTATTVEVGQGVSLVPVCSGGTTPVAGPYKWTITPDGTSNDALLKNYEPGPTSATKTKLTEKDDLNSDHPLSFYFAKAGTTYDVSVTSKSGISAEASFKVVEPTVTAARTGTCAVGLNTTHHRPLPLPTVGPGINNACDRPGIQFEFSITPQVVGRFAVIQVVEDEINGRSTIGVDHARGAALPFYPAVTTSGVDVYYTSALNGRQYPAVLKAKPGQVTTYSSEDSPASSLSGARGSQHARKMSVTDYVMFKPDNGVKSIWVAVSESYWYWAATSTKTGNGRNDWSLSHVVPINPNSNLRSASGEPAYSQWIEAAG